MKKKVFRERRAEALKQEEAKEEVKPVKKSRKKKEV